MHTDVAAPARAPFSGFVRCEEHHGKPFPGYIACVHVLAGVPIAHYVRATRNDYGEACCASCHAEERTPNELVQLVCVVCLVEALTHSNQVH